MKAVLADDEPQLATFLEERLEALWPELDIVGVAPNGTAALQMIQERRPELAFLDIKMPGLSGLEVAQRLVDSDCRVVFVTAYHEFALQAFEHHALDYLLKPVTDERLTRTLSRLKSSATATADKDALGRLLGEVAAALGVGQPARGTLRWIRASQNDKVRQIAVEDVLYFKAADKYTIVNVRKPETGGELLIRLSLAELLSELDNDVFWQIHRSCIVNLEHVEATRRDLLGKVYVQLRDGAGELAVSRQYAHRFRQM